MPGSHGGDGWRDDGESLGLFEPLMVSEGTDQRAVLNDLALDLAMRSAAFRASLPIGVTDAVAALIRSMNCYYSNLIEGHNTHPVDIDRALAGDYSHDPVQRNLQIEAQAHIAVQQWIDEGGLTAAATDPQMIREMHRRFCEALPEDMLVIDHPDTGERVRIVPGAFRDRDVAIGRHVAVSPGAVPRFLDRLHGAFDRGGRNLQILSAAAAHHRFLWVHPFLDGNGRVARLMSYAMLRQALDTGGLWSVARGLARSDAAYKRHLMACDGPRRGDRDGRGTLSEAALADFMCFFLRSCIDQVDFMQNLMRPDTLNQRIMSWVTEEIQAGRLPGAAQTVLQATLLHGELRRAALPDILGVNARTARRVSSALIASGALSSASSRAPLQLAFPARLAGRWMPGLFPAEP